MLGVMDKVGKSGSACSTTSLTRRSSGQPYLNLASVPSGTSHSAILRKTSSDLEPVRKTSSTRKMIQIQIPARRNYMNNNYGKTHNESKTSRVAAVPPTKSKESSQTSLSKRSSPKPVLSSISSFFESDTEEEGPNTGRMSKDIAKAVAMIVAEYELLQEQENECKQEVEVASEAEMKDGPNLPTNTVTPIATLTAIIDNHDSTSTKKEVKGKKREGEVAVDCTLNTATTTNINSDELKPISPSGVEPPPAVESSGGAAGEQEQTQSSQLPEKVEVVEKVKTRGSTAAVKDSIVTIGLELPKELAVRKRPTPRCTAVAPTPSREARMGGHVEVQRYLARVQQYVNALGYHREGEPETGINVRLSMKTHMLTAKDLIRASRQIKCLHAVVLCVHLTNTLDTVERFPIYFRSHVGSREYKHIVLGIYCQGHFGALGISRDVGLQDKKLIYTKLSDLILEFAKSYNDSGHILNEVKLGTIITHDHSSLEKLFSKIGTVPIYKHLQSDIEYTIEKIAKQLRAKMGQACLRSAFFDKQLSQNANPHANMRRSRSKASIEARYGSNNTIINTITSKASTNYSTVARPRANSLGPPLPPSIRFKSEDKIIVNQKNSKTSTRTRTKPPKSKRKKEQSFSP